MRSATTCLRYGLRFEDETDKFSQNKTKTIERVCGRRDGGGENNAITRDRLETHQVGSGRIMEPVRKATQINHRS